MSRYITDGYCKHGLEKRDGICIICSHRLTAYIAGTRRGIYRYRIANPGWRIGLNRIGGGPIGAYVNAGSYSYCVKWG